MAKRNAKISRLVSHKDVQHTLVRRLQGFGTPALGPLFTSLGGEDLADALVVHRLTKHFPKAGEEPVPPGVRKDRTLKAMIAYDKNGLTSFDYRKLQQPYRGLVLQARSSLHDFFRDMRRGRRFRAPSGETAIASYGETDLMFKLGDPEQWCVSLEAAKEAAAIGYNNIQLKRLIKARFKDEDPITWRARCDVWYAESIIARESPGFYVFQRMFLYCCNIQNYSRLSTVFKNETTDRPISMEPLWNMICQLSYADDIRQHLLRTMGIDLRSRAQLHRTLIRHANKATVDFSNASNSNWLAVLRFLLPPKVFAKLCELRTPVCKYRDEYHHYNMLAPMGCGFTFEVMTVVLLHIARVLDPGATVFGDDVIIESTVAEKFMDTCRALGWVVNTSKTFTEGNFRESCGGFHDLSTGRDLLSYEMHAIEDDFDACTTANKLYRICQKRQISHAIREVLWEAYSDLVDLLPRDVLRLPDEVTTDLPSGVVIVDEGLFEVQETGDGISRFLRTVLFDRDLRLARMFCYKPQLLHVSTCRHVLMASYFYRGEGYTPQLRNGDKLVKQTVVADANGALASYPLFEFI